MHRYTLLVFIFIFNIGANTLMEPTSLSKDLYDEIILDDNYEDSIYAIDNSTADICFGPYTL